MLYVCYSLCVMQQHCSMYVSRYAMTIDIAITILTNVTLQRNIKYLFPWMQATSHKQAFCEG